MSDYNLKPCPFCGGEAKMWRWNGRYGIQCENYNPTNPTNHRVQMIARTKDECVKKWNERKEEKQEDCEGE